MHIEILKKVHVIGHNVSVIQSNTILDHLPTVFPTLVDGEAKVIYYSFFLERLREIL